MEHLQQIRRARGWSRAELARRARLHPTTVGLIESGRLLPYPTQLAKLATALGVRREDLGTSSATAGPARARAQNS